MTCEESYIFCDFGYRFVINTKIKKSMYIAVVICKHVMYYIHMWNYVIYKNLPFVYFCMSVTDKSLTLVRWTILAGTLSVIIVSVY